MSGPVLPPLDVRSLLRQFGLHPSKGLGQNFLVEDAALRKIAALADLGPEEAVLEIGPGLGNLTRYLALSARSVVAVELDGSLFPVLRAVLAPYPNVRMIQGDILALSPSELMQGSGYVVVANLPYYITSAAIRHLLSGEARPQRAVLTLQREVAERLCAAPGDMSLLALSVQVYGKPEIVAGIPAHAFYPAPKVDSAVVRLEVYPQPVIPADRLEQFFRLAKAGFSQKRKTLRNALSGGLGVPAAQTEARLQSAGIDPRRRAETLSVEEWGDLVEKFE
jgi:16S rRNA (adenine1518-N6/adenine1519-N6)-dimethyltransferase